MDYPVAWPSQERWCKLRLYRLVPTRGFCG